MEPYIMTEGTARFFVEVDGGGATYQANDNDGNSFAGLVGRRTEYKGEILELGKGDVLLPMPMVAHRALFDDQTRFPFTYYCVNYAEKPLNGVPANDRIVLERP